MTEKNELLMADIMGGMAQAIEGMAGIMAKIMESSHPGTPATAGTQEMVKMFFEKCSIEALTHKPIAVRLIEVGSILDSLNDADSAMENMNSSNTKVIRVNSPEELKALVEKLTDKDGLDAILAGLDDRTVN